MPELTLQCWCFMVLSSVYLRMYFAAPQQSLVVPSLGKFVAHMSVMVMVPVANICMCAESAQSNKAPQDCMVVFLEFSEA